MKKQNKVSEYEQKYKEIEMIGKGTQGTAILIENRTDKKRFVSKKVFLTNLSEKDQKLAIQELKFLREMKHPNVVKFIESYKEKNKIIIIMEYCECGDLSTFIKEKAANKEQINENLILQWFVQICQALHFIHSKKVIHRDIKSSNIFITKSNCVKIGDFGISKQLDHSLDKANTLVGTPYYLSPEVCQNKPYTFKSDMWSLGCVLYELCALKGCLKSQKNNINRELEFSYFEAIFSEMKHNLKSLLLNYQNRLKIQKLKYQFIFLLLTNKHPFYSNSLMSLVMKISSEKAPTIPSGYSPMLEKFVKSLLKKQQEQRPSSADMLNNKNVKKLMKEFVLAKDNIVNDYQHKKQELIQQGATQREIKTLMEQQFQDKLLDNKQVQTKTSIESESQLIESKYMASSKQQTYNNYNEEESQTYQSMSISINQSQKGKQNQSKSLQNSQKKSNIKQNLQNSDLTVKSELMQSSSSKKRQQNMGYKDGENTIQSLAVSHFENTHLQSMNQSNTHVSNKKNQLGSTVKSREFIDEENNDNIHSSGMAASKNQFNGSQRTEADSQLLTSSEGERESEHDEDDLSERYSPSMALDLIQNESVLLSKFIDKGQTFTSNLGQTQPQLKNSQLMNNDSGIEHYSSENAVFYGTRILPREDTNDNFSETSVSMNVSLTQDSVFLKTKLGLTNQSLQSMKFPNQGGIHKQSNNYLNSTINSFANTNNFIEESIMKSSLYDEGFKIKKGKQSYKYDDKSDESISEQYEDDFEEYEDDFEEYKEEEDTKPTSNNSIRSSQQFDCHFLYESDDEKYDDEFDQLDCILDIYKKQLNEEDSMSESQYKFDLTEIIEESIEYSDLYSQKASQALNLKKKIH